MRPEKALTAGVAALPRPRLLPVPALALEALDARALVFTPVPLLVPARLLVARLLLVGALVPLLLAATRAAVLRAALHPRAAPRRSARAATVHLRPCPTYGDVRCTLRQIWQPNTLLYSVL